MQDPCFGAYSSVTDLLFGFDVSILRSAFGVCIYLRMYKFINVLQYRASQATLVDDLLDYDKWLIKLYDFK